ncbi:MAG: hypothetical protein J0H65_11860 [Rhizobiales bacterium]|nr:hypothetical protein [Hyphomicrobiales bacterium]
MAARSCRQQALQAEIKATRDRHASLAGELRTDMQDARLLAKEAQAEMAKTMEQRLDRPRSGNRSPKQGRDRDFDRGR